MKTTLQYPRHLLDVQVVQSMKTTKIHVWNNHFLGAKNPLQIAREID